METAITATTRALPATADARPQAATRLLFVDNIRVFLTVLVVLHHLMITYAHSGDWLYNEGAPDMLTQVLGAWFTAVNQTYFMGLFLFISAYFVPGAFDRKGAVRFLKDRIIRLGIPLAVYSWVVHPLLVYAYVTTQENMRLSFAQFYSTAFIPGGTWIGAGPLWFVEALLIFSAIYAGYRLLTRGRTVVVEREARFPSNAAIALFALCLALGTFIVRLWSPSDSNFRPLNFQFPYFVPYIGLFVAGLVAYRRNWLMNMPDAVGRRWLGVGACLTLLFVPGAVLGGALDNGMDPFKGGWHWQAMLSAVWEAFMCLALCIGVVYLFRRFANRQGTLAAALSRNAYTAYIVHAPVIVAVALAFQSVAIFPLLKWAVVALVAVPLCFVLSSLIRKLPYTGRVL